MTITELIYALECGTNVRIKIVGHKEFAGKTGPKKTQELVATLKDYGCDNALVGCIYPLYRAQEVYITCMRVLH